jgi:hypothetical protein
MSPIERQEPDRDPAVARKTTRPCAIEDGEEKTTAWERLSSRLARRRKRPEPPEAVPSEPDTLPEAPPNDDLPENNE